MEIKNRLSLRPEDSENLTDVIRGIDTVQVAVFFEELKSNDIRISMRSKNVNLADVSKICGNFGGGGHPLAAGAKVEGDVFGVEGDVLNYIDRLIS
jgi:phosphoesterase RecJ-like protein